MKDMSKTSKVASVGAAAALAVTLAGCGSSGHSNAKGAASANPPSAATGTAKPSTKITGKRAPKFVGVQHPIPSGKALANIPDMYKYVLKTGCSSITGGWQAVGTARNTTAEPLPFKILVFFTDAQARIVDSASTTVSVPAKATGHWTASRRFKAPKGTQCVVRAVNKG